MAVISISVFSSQANRWDVSLCCSAYLAETRPAGGVSYRFVVCFLVSFWVLYFRCSTLAASMISLSRRETHPRVSSKESMLCGRASSSACDADMES